MLFLGRIERRKGLEPLLQAMTRLRGGARLIVAGSGPEERRCRALATRLALDVTFMGRVDEQQKRDLFRSCGVYCAPALGGESFGIVLVEAMAAGAPVVCSDLPGFRAVGSGAALLVPPGDPGRLADALRSVLRDDEVAGRMSKLGAKAAAIYDWARLVPNVEGIYEAARVPVTEALRYE